MTIIIGGQPFTQEQVFNAIAASNDPAPTNSVIAYDSLAEVSGVLQSVLLRLQALENISPTTRTGFGVTTTVENGYTCYRVQMLDQNGATQIVEFKLPLTTSSSSSY